jgi:ABC-type branched-subunit amino acid transport system ATPase component
MFLELREVNKSFGKAKVIQDLSLIIEEGGITALIGPNGSGKTTTFNLIAGSLRADSGRILFRGVDITALPAYARALKGIVRTFQHIRVLSNLTVEENLKFATQSKHVLSSSDHAHTTRGIGPHDVSEAIRILDLVRLRQEKAKTLSHGQRKLLANMMAFVNSPDSRIMLLDEPFAGLSEHMIVKMKDLIRRFNQSGRTFFIIEHRIETLTDFCEKVLVLDRGRLIAQGTVAEVRHMPQVAEAYLGGAHLE